MRKRPRTLTADEVAQVRRWCRGSWILLAFLSPLLLLAVLVFGLVAVIIILDGSWLAAGASSFGTFAMIWICVHAVRSTRELGQVTTATLVQFKRGAFRVKYSSHGRRTYYVDNYAVNFVDAEIRRSLTLGGPCEIEWIMGTPPLVITARSLDRPWRSGQSHPSKQSRRRRRDRR